MKTFYHPVVGMFLNILLFGSVNLLTGHISLGLAKLFLYFIVIPFSVAMFTSWVSSFFASSLLGVLIERILVVIYVILAGRDGYKTFARVQQGLDSR